MYETTYHYTTDASSTPQIASSTTVIATSSQQEIATSSDIVIIPTMTTGEILVSFLLFAIMLLMISNLLFGALDRIKTKRTYMSYGGGDVEIRDDI